MPPPPPWAAAAARRRRRPLDSYGVLARALSQRSLPPPAVQDIAFLPRAHCNELMEAVTREAVRRAGGGDSSVGAAAAKLARWLPLLLLLRRQGCERRGRNGGGSGSRGCLLSAASAHAASRAESLARLACRAMSSDIMVLCRSAARGGRLATGS